MNLTRRNVNAAGLALLAGATVGTAGTPTIAAGGPVADLPEGVDNFALAVEAYIYAYPLVTMEITRRIITNVAEAKGSRGPMRHVIKLRQYPDANFRDVTVPNADTLSTVAFFDVGDEPWVVSVWLLGRIYCTGTPEDYAGVHKLQDQVKLTPLSQWGKRLGRARRRGGPFSIDMETSVRDQVNRMDATEYFTLFAELLKRNPSTEADAPMVASSPHLASCRVRTSIKADSIRLW